MNESFGQKSLYNLGWVFVLGFCLKPVIFMLVTALGQNPEYLAEGTDFIFTLGNFSDVLFTDNLHFMDYLKNSLLVSALSALGAVSIATLAAFSISRLRPRGRMMILFVALAMSMFPQVSIVGYLFKIFSGLGWINSYIALILPYIAWVLPLSLWILVSYFSQLPDELDQAARLDGCGAFQIYWRIIIPIALPAVLSTLLLVFIFAFNEFMFALILTSDHSTRTVPVGIALFQGLHGEIPWGNIMAAACITTIPVIILTVLFQRRIVAGLSAGAVKG